MKPWLILWLALLAVTLSGCKLLTVPSDYGPARPSASLPEEEHQAAALERIEREQRQARYREIMGAE